MTINERQNQIIEEFEGVDDWDIRYEIIIEQGLELPSIEERFKTPEHLIEGCQSKVWLNAELLDGKVYYTAQTESSIIKGIIAMIISVFNGHTPEEILNADLYFIDKIGLSSHLSPTRSNGLLATVKQMKYYALAFKELESRH